MKNIKKFVAIIIMGITHLYTLGYECSFFNDTTTAIAIAIQFADSGNEPLYKLYIKPGTMKSFVPGTVDIPDIKWSACLHNVYYFKDPTIQERAHNFAQIKTWRKVAITWSDMPLETTKHKKLLPQQRKKQAKQRAQMVMMAKKNIPTDSKSLCKDRHFEITEDQDGHIVITASLVE